MSKKDQTKKLRLTLIRSLSGRLKQHIATVECLGLRRINQSVEVETNPSMMGMVNKVSYLLKIEEV
jgi:large subunit ribosomal protein L30